MSNSIVKELAVYRNGCFIKRSGTVNLSAGKQTVIIDCLPQSLDSSTLTLSLPENISGTNVQVELLDAKQKEEITKDIQHKINSINTTIEIKKTQIEMWNRNADFSAKDSLNIVEMSNYIEALPARLEKLYSEIVELEDEKSKLNEELKDKNNEAESYLVKADIETSQAGEYPFNIRYFDSNAYWYPTYEIHTSEEDNLSIVLKAKIAQDTNEDFKDIKLKLFSANPTMSQDIPVLNPNRLSFYSSAPRMMAGKAAGAYMNMAMMDYEESGAIEEPEMEDVRTFVGNTKQDDTMMEYELSGLWNLESKKPISADISENKVSCRYHVIAMPKLDDCAYLAAEVNTSDIEDLLETNAMIYHKGTYIGEFYLNPSPDEEKYDISLGRDETIKLKRNQKRKFTSNVLLKNQKKTEYEYELKITSSKNRSFPVTLIDQVPVSQDKSIVVDIVNISGAKHDEDTGRLTWEFDIEPSQSKTIDLAYNVSWPKEKTLSV